MLGLYGEYQVVVAGAGIAGVVASIAARRQGAKVLLLEDSGTVGGMVTGGRLTKPHGPVDGGIFLEMIQRAASVGGANLSTWQVHWGEFGAVLDPEVMQRVILEMLEEAGVEVLLHARVVDVLQDSRVRGLEVAVKSGRKAVLGRAAVDATGDGDVAALAGAPFLLGRPADGKTQPISSYLRVVNVDTPRLARYMREHPEEFTELVLPEGDGKNPEDYRLNLLASGFGGLIDRARKAGDWKVPKGYISVKSGMMPGEVNLNATRFQGNGLDERTLSEAEIELRKQAYNVVDFLRKYVPGFEQALLLEVAPKLGVRETRRILGDYLLSGDDVKAERRFPDAIALSRSGLDIHEPGGEGGLKLSVGAGYGIPYRCLLPKGVDGLLVAGRCISTDEIAFGSTRNVPTCAQTGQAAGTAAALAVQAGLTPRQLNAAELQAALRSQGLALGTS